MDKFTKWTIVILSLQLTACSIVISHLFYKLGYEQGRASVYQSFSDGPDVGTCYQVGGCGDLPQTKRRGHK